MIKIRFVIFNDGLVLFVLIGSVLLKRRRFFRSRLCVGRIFLAGYYSLFLIVKIEFGEIVGVTALF
jgi:hypothetical protein